MDAIIFSLTRAYYAYVRHLERLLAEHGLDDRVRPGMGHLFFALFEEDGVIIKRLVERTRLPTSTVGRLLRQMEQKGFIVRKPCDADGRAVRIELSPLGRSLEVQLFAMFRRMKRTVEARLAPEEIAVLKAGLDQITENVSEET